MFKSTLTFSMMYISSQTLRDNLIILVGTHIRSNRSVACKRASFAPLIVYTPINMEKIPLPVNYKYPVFIIPRRIIVAGYYGFTLVIRVSVRPSVARTSVRCSFPDDNLSNYQWIFTKLGMCIDIVEI